MKKWKIKWKIIFWYSLIFALLIGLELYFFHQTSNNVILDQSTQQLVLAVEEVNSAIELEDDGLYIELEGESEKFNYDHDGVNFLLYQGNTLVFGPTPTGFDPSMDLSVSEIQSQESGGTSWLVYDVNFEGNYTLRGVYDMSFINSSFQQIFLVAWILSPIVIILASLGGYFIIKRSFKPISKIYQTAYEIKNKEDYSKRIDINVGRDEIYELADMVNQMLNKVEASINREKQFSSNVSHELRTPLTVMHAQVEYLLDKVNKKDNAEELQAIMKQINFMENIVTQLLELTRAKHISSENLEVIDIVDLVQLSADSFGEILAERKITLSLEKPTDSIYVMVHQTLMIRTFSNLIFNAIKYNKTPGFIYINFSYDKEMVHIHIADQGIGMDKDQLDKIFDPFYRVDESRTQSQSLGLGLAMVKEIIQLHQGTITVESQKNIGTTFTISLPKIIK